MRRITPLFALDDQGVKLLAVPYASRIEPKIEPKIEPMSEAVKGGKMENKSGAVRKSLSGGEAADQTPKSSQSGISAVGLRGAIL